MGLVWIIRDTRLFVVSVRGCCCCCLRSEPTPRNSTRLAAVYYCTNAIGLVVMVVMRQSNTNANRLLNLRRPAHRSSSAPASLLVGERVDGSADRRPIYQWTRASRCNLLARNKHNKTTCCRLRQSMCSASSRGSSSRSLPSRPLDHRASRKLRLTGSRPTVRLLVQANK